MLHFPKSLPGVDKNNFTVSFIVRIYFSTHLASLLAIGCFNTIQGPVQERLEGPTSA
jgi:hypothetical protein